LVRELALSNEEQERLAGGIASSKGASQGEREARMEAEAATRKETLARERAEGALRSIQGELEASVKAASIAQLAATVAKQERDQIELANISLRHRIDRVQEEESKLRHVRAAGIVQEASARAKEKAALQLELEDARNKLLRGAMETGGADRASPPPNTARKEVDTPSPAQGNRPGAAGGEAMLDAYGNLNPNWKRPTATEEEPSGGTPMPPLTKRELTKGEWKPPFGGGASPSSPHSEKYRRDRLGKVFTIFDVHRSGYIMPREIYQIGEVWKGGETEWSWDQNQNLINDMRRGVVALSSRWETPPASGANEAGVNEISFVSFFHQALPTDNTAFNKAIEGFIKTARLSSKRSRNTPPRAGQKSPARETPKKTLPEPKRENAPVVTEQKKTPESKIPPPSGWSPLARTINQSHLKPKGGESRETGSTPKEKESKPLSAKGAAKAKIAGMKGELKALQEAVAKAGIAKRK